MRDISFEVMAKHLVQISAAITDARKDLVEQGMTWINSDMYSYLKKAQNDIDVLRHAIRPSGYTTVSGEVAHGYVAAGYKIGQDYYGHANFGHKDCGKEGQKRVSIPLEEFGKFVHDIPSDSRCAACGRNVLLRAEEQPGPHIVDGEEREVPEMPLGMHVGLHIVPDSQEHSSGEDDPFEHLSFEEQIDPARWSGREILRSSTFHAQLTDESTLFLAGPALHEGFSLPETQALTQFLSERVKLPPKEPLYAFEDFTPIPSEGKDGEGEE
jgi:hypothetical protein